MIFKLAWRNVIGNCIPSNPDRLLQRRETQTFPGYCFRPRLVKNAWNNQLFWGFNPAVSPAALNNIRSTIRDLGFRRQTDLALDGGLVDGSFRESSPPSVDETPSARRWSSGAKEQVHL
jgi:hypothetical protein